MRMLDFPPPAPAAFTSHRLSSSVLRRQRTGSVLCTSCGVLVGVNDETCYNCGRRNPGLWGFAPALRALGHDMGFVPFVIGACVVMYGLSLLVTVAYLRQPLGMGGLFNMFSPANEALFLLGSSGAIPVFAAGRWWTVLSAGWLHGGILHILFNMSVVRQMAPATADVYGPGRMIIIYVAGAVGGFTLSAVMGEYFSYLPWPLAPGGFTVGASASIAGLIGAIMHFGRRGGSGMARSYASRYIVMLVIIGFFPGIDNYAHAGGFAGGYLASRVMDPLKPERIDHIAIAVLLLAISLISVLVSFFHGLQFLRPTQ
jgi:rhomboid protease GluP